MTAPSSVLLAGGGSAGHVSPLLSVADALRRRWPDVTITALGTVEGLEVRLVPAQSVFSYVFGARVKVRDKDAGVVAALTADDLLAVAAELEPTPMIREGEQ